VNPLCSRNAQPEKALALANGTSRRASGWAGEKVARSGGSARPPPKKEKNKLEYEGHCSRSMRGEGRLQ
jgi:hypothetical protein